MSEFDIRQIKLGEDVTAEAIHERSARAEGAYVPVHCAAIPQQHHRPGRGYPHG